MSPFLFCARGEEEKRNRLAPSNRHAMTAKEPIFSSLFLVSLLRARARGEKKKSSSGQEL